MALDLGGGGNAPCMHLVGHVALLILLLGCQEARYCLIGLGLRLEVEGCAVVVLRELHLVFEVEGVVVDSTCCVDDIGAGS